MQREIEEIGSLHSWKTGREINSEIINPKSKVCTYERIAHCTVRVFNGQPG